MEPNSSITHFTGFSKIEPIVIILTKSLRLPFSKLAIKGIQPDFKLLV
ncbi:hypothetical protein D1BOALGB6SA_6869 [Olavius sp. associated proteobacterium Delta 1]|nr:hypothetical protein D1BOALGB6SA_6869 [Olavius sp. associated proteobacterium Delta 1]